LRKARSKNNTFENKKNFFMEEKILTVKIFERVKTARELELVCGSFKWLIDNGFLKRDPLLYFASIKAFNRIHKL